MLNPAEPPLIMRDTVFVLCEPADQGALEASIESMVTTVQAYVPGYRLKQRVQFDVIPADAPVNLPKLGPRHGLKVSIFLEVEAPRITCRPMPATWIS